VYYAYDLIHTNSVSPFQSTHGLTLFNCARFLLMRMLAREGGSGAGAGGGAAGRTPRGVSQAAILLTLAHQSMRLKAYKLARFAYTKLQVGLLFSAYHWFCFSANMHTPSCSCMWKCMHGRVG
jgi:hypothetical protein